MLIFFNDLSRHAQATQQWEEHSPTPPLETQVLHQNLILRKVNMAFVAQSQAAHILESATCGVSLIHQAISAAIAAGMRMRLQPEQQRKSSTTAMHTLAKQIIMIGHTPEKDGRSLAETASCLLQKSGKKRNAYKKKKSQT